MNDEEPKTVTFADIADDILASIRAGGSADRHILARLERIDVFRANGVPEEDLPPIPDDLLRLATPDTIRPPLSGEPNCYCDTDNHDAEDDE